MNKTKKCTKRIESSTSITYLQPKNIDYIPHNNLDKDWFEDYFGFNELEKIIEYLPKIEKSLRYDTKKPGDYSKNISFIIDNTKFEVGDFGILSFSELKKLQTIEEPKPDSKGLKYDFIKGDISELINIVSDSENAVFQAASQFNLLEMSDPSITPKHGISIYKTDNTQGPRVALSSPTGTFFRNYLLSKITNIDQIDQINTLNGVLESLNFKEIDDSSHVLNTQYVYKNGYVYINTTDVDFKDTILEEIFNDNLKVGIHLNTPLLSDYNKKVCQVYCSALPISYWMGYSDENLKKIKLFAIKLLKYAYKCTMQVAVNKITIEKPRSTVYLTAVGGGAFGNDITWIQQALIEALYDFEEYPLDVKMIWFTDHDGNLNKALNTTEIISKIFKIKYLKYKIKYLNLKYLK